MGMKIFLVLRNSKNPISKYKLSFNLLENQLAKSWLNLFSYNFFEIDHPIEKDNSLKGWITSWDNHSPRNIDFLCNQINLSISEINSVMVPLGYHYIDLVFTKEKLQEKNYRDLMNDIHHHFEILIGQSWNPSKWWNMADDNTRQHIRLINNLCHEIETAVDSIQLNQRFPEHSNQYIFGSLMGRNFNGNHISGKQTKELSLEELESFSDYTEWGDMTIYYAQLGKRHIEAFRDNDTFIDRDNISGYRYLTGEFVISFPFLFDQHIYQPREFFDWLDKNNFDKTDPKLALGFPVIAKLESKETKKEIIKIIKQMDDIYEIGLEDDFGNVVKSKTYNFYWTDLP
jgi:hypothetical protein